MRGLVEKVTGLDKEAELPKYAAKSFEKHRRGEAACGQSQPLRRMGRKAVIYATCFANYNEPDIGVAARAVLAKNGVETEVLHPHCCGMPLLEQGDIAEVARSRARPSPPRCGLGSKRAMTSSRWCRPAP